MATQTNVKILTKDGEMLWQHHYKKSDVVTVDANFAHTHLFRFPKRFKATNEEAKIVAPLKRPEPTPEELEEQRLRDEEGLKTESSEIYALDFPGKEDLGKAGINTVEQLVKFLADNGDSWFTKVNGIGKKTAADVIEHMDGLNSDK